MTKREADYLTWLFIRTRRRLPLRGSLSSAFGAPLLQGATQQSCKNADPSQGLLPHIVISSAARNLPCTTVKRRAPDEEQPKHLGDFYHYLISIEYRYDVKDPSATLGMTIREAGYLTWLFIRTRRRLPLRGSLSSAFGAPLLQGAAPLACKSATPKRHSLPDGKVNEMRIPLSPISSFRAKREIFLAHRSSDEREMRSST